MTDAELDKLKPGDRVLWNASEYAVHLIDRRKLVLQHLDDPYSFSCGVSAVDVTCISAPVEPLHDDTALQSLTSRWRALTDEVLVAIRQAVADGVPLTEIAVMFWADASIARADVLLASTAATLERGELVTCAVGVIVSNAPNAVKKGDKT